MRQLPWERLMIGIIAVGASDFALEETLKYVRERKALGNASWIFRTRVLSWPRQKRKLR